MEYDKINLSSELNETFNIHFIKDNEIIYSVIVLFLTPKLIAKAGEYVKIVDYGHSMINVDDDIVKLLEDLTEDTFIFEDDHGERRGWSGNFKNVGMKLEKFSAPVQRKSIGVYKSVEIFPDTEAWYVNLKDLRIVTLDCTKTINEYIVRDWPGAYGISSEVYLSPKDANQRLREEIERKSSEKTFTIAELKDFDKYDHTAIGYAIELLEKQYGITYLEE